MAIQTYTTEGQVLIRQITQENFADLLAQANDPAEQIAPALIVNVGGAGLEEFRTIVNANFATINGIIPVAGLVTLDGGDSWDTCRDKLNTNFALADAVID